MNLDDLLKRAEDIKSKYDQLNKQKRGIVWNGQDFMAGFVGDVGALSKIIMAKHGLRDDVDNVDVRLAHQLIDCLWSVLVLAHEYNVDLETEFTKTMDELEKRIGRGDG